MPCASSSGCPRASRRRGSLSVVQMTILRHVENSCPYESSSSWNGAKVQRSLEALCMPFQYEALRIWGSLCHAGPLLSLVCFFDFDQRNTWQAPNYGLPLNLWKWATWPCSSWATSSIPQSFVHEVVSWAQWYPEATWPFLGVIEARRVSSNLVKQTWKPTLSNNNTSRWPCCGENDNDWILEQRIFK